MASRYIALLAVLCITTSNLAFAQVSPEWRIIQERKIVEPKIEPFRSVPAAGRLIKIGDLTDVVGDENVMLTGFGIVSGLNGTGDGSVAAAELLTKVAQNQGIQINPADIQGKNLALVSISAEVSPYQRIFDVAVKSIGDAKSLQNGFLEASTLSPIGSDTVYAVCSGSLSLGARYFSTNDKPQGGAAATNSASVTIGHPTMAFVINGGELTKEIPSNRMEDNKLTLFLKHPNDRTSMHIANSINQHMGSLGIEAEPTNAAIVTVKVSNYHQATQGRITQLIADINDLPSAVSRKAIITIDQGSGVIAMTEGVKMEPGSITVAGITVSVSSELEAVANKGLMGGNTVLENQTLSVNQGKSNFLSIPAGTDLRQVQETLNAMKLTPTSMISVFNAMHKAGMIHAELIILPR